MHCSSNVLVTLCRDKWRTYLPCKISEIFSQVVVDEQEFCYINFACVSVFLQIFLLPMSLPGNWNTTSTSSTEQLLLPWHTNGTTSDNVH